MQTGARSNGGIHSIGEVMRRLRSHRPIVLTNVDSPFTRGWRDEGIETHIEPARPTDTLSISPLRYLAAHIRYTRKLRCLVRTSGARVVHANDQLAFQYSLAAARLSGAKLILNLRGTPPPDRAPRRLKFLCIFAAADHVLYLSNDMARRWRAVAANAGRACSITYSVVDPARFKFTPTPTDGDPVVLVSGVFRPLKRQLEFIRFVVPILARNGVTTWFAGDFDPEGAAYSKACASAAEPFAEHVRFLGFRDDLPQLMAHARVVAIPSMHEGLVRAMLEGMSSGRPIVSFEVSSASEILEQESRGGGVVVPSGDFPAMADAIVRYCGDRAAAAEAGKKAYEAARRLFAPSDVVKRYERVYALFEGKSDGRA